MLVLGLASLSWGCAKQLDLGSPRAMAWHRHVQRVHGTTVSFGEDSRILQMPGFEWTPLEETAWEEAIVQMSSEFARYEEMGIRLPERVVLVKALARDGAPMGGYARGRVSEVVITWDAYRAGRDGPSVIGLHHELGHILLGRDCAAGLEREWSAITPNAYSAWQPKENPTHDARPEGYGSGVLCNLGRKSWSEDVATFYQLHMSSPETLARLARAHPPIAAKRALVLGLIDRCGKASGTSSAEVSR